MGFLPHSLASRRELSVHRESGAVPQFDELRRASTAAVCRAVFGRGLPQLVAQRRRKSSAHPAQDIIRAVSTPAQRRGRRHLTDESPDARPIERLLRAEAMAAYHSERCTFYTTHLRRNQLMMRLLAPTARQPLLPQALYKTLTAHQSQLA